MQGAKKLGATKLATPAAAPGAAVKKATALQFESFDAVDEEKELQDKAAVQRQIDADAALARAISTGDAAPARYPPVLVVAPG